MSLIQASHKQAFVQKFLPMSWKGLYDSGVRFKESDVILISAGPGGGKSAFVLNYLVQSNIPTLYMSADSDMSTQAIRSLSIKTGLTLAESYGKVLNEPEWVKNVLKTIPISFSFDTDPTLGTVEKEVKAYKELYGTFPKALVIDNVLDINLEDSYTGDITENLETIIGWLHDVAKRINVTVFALHHVTGGYNNSDIPIPLNGIKGQAARIPEMVLTLHRPYEGALGVSVVKNRGGVSDASGQSFIPMYFDGSRMLIQDRI